jgi:hypothetical protein
MNEQETNNGFPFWPALFVILALNLFLVTQVHMIWRGTNRLKQQSEVVSKRIEQAEAQMAPARTWLTMLEGIANDLLELAKTDADVRAVVEKYQIRKNQPPAPPESKDAKPSE